VCVCVCVHGSAQGSKTNLPKAAKLVAASRAQVRMPDLDGTRPALLPMARAMLMCSIGRAGTRANLPAISGTADTAHGGGLRARSSHRPSTDTGGCLWGTLWFHG